MSRVNWPRSKPEREGAEIRGVEKRKLVGEDKYTAAATGSQRQRGLSKLMRQRDDGPQGRNIKSWMMTSKRQRMLGSTKMEKEKSSEISPARTNCGRGSDKQQAKATGRRARAVLGTVGEGKESGSQDPRKW